MKIEKTKHQCGILILVSWLTARMWWALEFSRLAFCRTNPRKVVVYKIDSPMNDESYWSYEKNRLSVLKYDEKNSTCVIFKFTETPFN